MKKVIDLLNEDQDIIDVDINDEIQLGTEGPVIDPRELLMRTHKTYLELEIWRFEMIDHYEYVVHENGNDIGIEIAKSYYNVIQIYVENMASYIGSGFCINVRISGIDFHAISEINDMVTEKISSFVIPGVEKGLAKKKEELEKLEKEIQEYEKIIRECKRAEKTACSLIRACDPKIKEILVFE